MTVAPQCDSRNVAPIRITVVKRRNFKIHLTYFLVEQTGQISMAPSVWLHEIVFRSLVKKGVHRLQRTPACWLRYAARFAIDVIRDVTNDEKIKCSDFW